MCQEKKLPMPDDLMDLPGFREAKKQMEGKGYKSDWLTRMPDTENPYTVFIPNKGKSNYKSDCPYNEGYYLSGGIGGVKCSRCASILPGHMWYETCDKNHLKCPYYSEKN